MSLVARTSWSWIAVSFVRIDESGALRRVCLRQQALHRDFGEPGVGVVTIKIGVGQFHGLDLLVQLHRALRSASVRLERAHDVQHLERRHALAVGRKFVNLPAAIVDGNRLNPFRGKVGQIVQLHGSAERRRSAYDSLCDLALVKCVAPLLGNQPQSFAHIRIGEPGAKFRSLAAGKKDSARFAVLLQLGFFSHPIVVHDLGDGVTVLSVVNCRSEEILPRQASEALVGLAPSFHGAGNGDAVNPVPGMDVMPCFARNSTDSLRGAQPLEFRP